MRVIHRECPGRFVADSTIWLMDAMTLATFDIAMAQDEHGRNIVPEVSYSGGLVRCVFFSMRITLIGEIPSHPLPFKCTIKPRSSRAAALIEA